MRSSPLESTVPTWHNNDITQTWQQMSRTRGPQRPRFRSRWTEIMMKCASVCRPFRRDWRSSAAFFRRRPAVGRSPGSHVHSKGHPGARTRGAGPGLRILSPPLRPPSLLSVDQGVARAALGSGAEFVRKLRRQRALTARILARIGAPGADLGSVRGSEPVWASSARLFRHP